jgi:heme exporter protein C
MNVALRLLLGLAFAAVTVYSFTVPNAKLFMEPELARMIFFHLSCAFSSVVALIATCYFSIRYLATKSPAWDIRAAAMSELTLTFMVLTLLTGILFSRVQWGHWWHSDPRQTSFLIATLMYGAYFLTRMGFADEQKRAASSAVYALSMVLPILFLVFVYPRLPQVLKQSVHPSNTIQGGLLVGDYRNVFLAVWILLMITAFWLYRMRVRAVELEAAAEDAHAKLAHGGPATPTGVVRPLSLSSED